MEWEGKCVIERAVHSHIINNVTVRLKLHRAINYIIMIILFSVVI